MSAPRADRPLRLALSAGEPSGDAIGAALIRALRHSAEEGLALTGGGGPQMASEGFDPAYGLDGLAVMGLRDVLPAIPTVLARSRRFARIAAANAADAAVLIDSWGFHHQAALRLRRHAPHIPIIRYAAPQVWASRPHRAEKVRPFADRILTLFPFEPPFFEAYGIDAQFVGHPVFEWSVTERDADKFRNRYDIASDAPLLVVLPGSRPNELRALLPIFGVTLAALAETCPALRLATVVTDGTRDRVAAAAQHWPGAPIIIENSDTAEKRACFKAATVALAASGTVVMELAHAGTVPLVAYKVGPLTKRWALKRLRIKHAAVPNHVAGREVIPEYVQDTCRPELLKPALARLLQDAALREEIRLEIGRQMAKLAPPSPPSVSAAAAILEIARKTAAHRAAGAPSVLTDQRASMGV